MSNNPKPSSSMSEKIEEIILRHGRWIHGDTNTKALNILDARDELLDLLASQREEIVKGLNKTWSGCACGFHGYTTLPDCKEEKHDIKKCADCFLDSLSPNRRSK